MLFVLHTSTNFMKIYFFSSATVTFVFYFELFFNLFFDTVILYKEKILLITRVVIISLAAELLREAEKLIDQKIHPQIIIAGWRKATNIARNALQQASMDNR